MPLILKGNSDEALDSSEPIVLGHCMCPFISSSENVQVYLYRISCNAFWGEKISWLEFWDQIYWIFSLGVLQVILPNLKFCRILFQDVKFIFVEHGLVKFIWL